MLPVVLLVLAVLFIVLAFTHVVSLLVGLGIALACVVALLAINASGGRWWS